MMNKNDDIVAEPADDYESLRKQYLALRMLANSKSRQVSHWRNQCGAEMRETLLANSENVNAERDTNQLLTDLLLATEQERDQLKAENEKLKARDSEHVRHFNELSDFRHRTVQSFDRKIEALKAENALFTEREILQLAEIEVLRKDAERYRWLRKTENWNDAEDHPEMVADIFIVESYEKVFNRSGEKLDKTVDYFISKDSGQ